MAVKGTQLLYDGKAVGTVTEGEKQFAVVNTKMVIWPDKVYLDLNSNTVKPLGAKISGTGGTFTAEKLTVSGWGDLTKQFKAGDAVTISGCTAQTKNNKDIILKAVTATELTVAKNTLAEGAETGTLTLERRVPDLDFICESENRLWGCSSEKQTIYASSLGDPTNFYVYAGLSTDSYALAVGTEGEFTGCCKQTSSVLFWKETCTSCWAGIRRNIACTPMTWRDCGRAATRAWPSSTRSCITWGCTGCMPIPAECPP